MTRFWLLAALVSALPAQAQDLLGHGGPVGALALGEGVLVSGSFDTRAILWDSDTAQARNVTRFHDGSVTAVALHPQGGFVTAGQDGRVALWDADSRAPSFATAAGSSAVESLSVAPDGQQIAAGFRDGQIVAITPDTGEERAHQAHSDRVTGLAYLPSGELVSVGSDFRLMRWDVDFTPRMRADLPALPNGLVISHGRVAVIFADGALRLYSTGGEELPERFLTDRPLVAVAATQSHIAAGGIDGTVWLLEAEALGRHLDFAAHDGPVWALALDTAQVFSSGQSGVIRRWSLSDGQALGAGDTPQDGALADGSRGAEIWQACAVCHALAPGDHRRAGPSLHGIFGQKIASQQGYDYSPALQELDITWSKETVAELFEYGPDAYTPGSRMPEQRIADPEDRQALVEYIARASE